MKLQAPPPLPSSSCELRPDKVLKKHIKMAQKLRRVPAACYAESFRAALELWEMCKGHFWVSCPTTGSWRKGLVGEICREPISCHRRKEAQAQRPDRQYYGERYYTITVLYSQGTLVWKMKSSHGLNNCVNHHFLGIENKTIELMWECRLEKKIEYINLQVKSFFFSPTRMSSIKYHFWPFLSE